MVRKDCIALEYGLRKSEQVEEPCGEVVVELPAALVQSVPATWVLPTSVPPAESLGLSPQFALSNDLAND